MKKLKLKSFKLGATEILTGEQMKNVMRSTVGGTGSNSGGCCCQHIGNDYNCGMSIHLNIQ